MNKMQFHSQFLAQVLAESLVVVTLFATKMEVAMGCFYVMSFINKHSKQSHTVRATA